MHLLSRCFLRGWDVPCGLWRIICWDLLILSCWQLQQRDRHAMLIHRVPCPIGTQFLVNQGEAVVMQTNNQGYSYSSNKGTSFFQV